MGSFRNLLFAVIAVAASAGFMLGGPSSPPAPTIATAAAAGTDIADTVVSADTTNNADEKTTGWSHGHDGADANADAHWRKHGNEFSEDHSAQEYEDEASDFIQHPPPGAEIKHRANGDTLIYDRDSNTFAVENRDGETRTMFKPDRGEAYWDRQH
jgi:pyocin large subunit-like protein